MCARPRARVFFRIDESDDGPHVAELAADEVATTEANN